MHKLLLISLMLTGTAFGQVDLGKELSAVEHSGVPEFGLVLNDNPPLIMGAVILSGKKLLEGKKLETLAWRYFDEKKQKFVGDWTDSGLYPSYMDGDAGLNLLSTEEVAKEVARNLPNMILVLSLNKGAIPTITHHIRINVFCTWYPSAFKNSDTQKMGCDQ